MSIVSFICFIRDMGGVNSYPPSSLLTSSINGRIINKLVTVVLFRQDLKFVMANIYIYM